MAKTARQATAAVSVPAKSAAGSLSAATKRLIESVKRPFTAFSKAYGQLEISRSDLAPKFVKAFEAFKKDFGNGRGALISFVRLLDPSVPATRGKTGDPAPGYREHPSYQSANYLIRAVGRTDSGDARTRPMRSNLGNLARAIATMLQTVKDPEAVWNGVKKEFTLTDRQMATLRKVTAASKPLFTIEIAKPLTKVSIIHVEPEEAAETVRSARAAAA